MKLPDFVIKNPDKALLSLCGAAAAAFIALALVSQYGFGLHPCHLCIAQRVPYAFIVVVALLAHVMKLSPKRTAQLVMVCAVLFFVDAGIAVYHSGVEMGYFPGPSGCTNSDKPGESIEEMRAAIMNAALVPCDQAMVYFIGLSMASWNAITAFTCGVLTLVTHRKISKVPHA